MSATLIQTTIAGSLPKPSWLAKPQTLWAPWLLSGEQLVEGKRDAVRAALARSLAEAKLKALAAGAALLNKELAGR